jgi:hypothetical protein
MIDVIHKRCQSSWCDIIITQKYEGYCLYCYINLFPDKKISRNYKTKEKTITDYINDKFKDIDITADKRIYDGCSRRRPDIFIDIGYQIIIVEIDENQHKNYDCSCENKRIMEISNDVGHRPIIFIRFNPDDYEKDGNKIKSCWKINKLGIYCIKKSKMNEWNERLKRLEEAIRYWLHPINKTDKFIEIINLYYDE